MREQDLLKEIKAVMLKKGRYIRKGKYMKTFDEIEKLEKENLASTYKRFPLLIKSGKGALCKDEAGREYIDLTSGIGVNSFGFSDDIMAEAVAKQMKTLTHTSNLFYTEQQTEAAKLIIEKSRMKKVFFCNSGAEANEAAIKTARKYSHDKYGKNRHEIITLINSFHGRTMATITATGQEKYHKDFDPFLPGIKHVYTNDIDALKENINGNTGAIMIELIQGEGGVINLKKDYVKVIESICDKNDILLIVDEVQTGGGRCGAFLCSELYGIKPDIITMAKGIGGGLPVGACLFNEKTADVLNYGDHGTTFGGNPVILAAVRTVLERMDDKLYESVKSKGDYIVKILKENEDIIEDISGAGLMIGFTPKKKKAGEAVLKGIELGVMALTANEKVRLLPPLNIKEEELKKGMELLLEACRSI